MHLIKFYKSGYLLQHCNYNFGLILFNQWAQSSNLVVKISAF